VRVDLKDTRPPCWRRLELSSDLFLDELHLVLQAAFGWTDSHLHHFASGLSRRDPLTEYYLCSWLAEDGHDGLPEDQVRLDEVLVDAGDRLFYLYDFGDGWEHTIKLEAVLPRRTGGPQAVCVAGRRDGPPENCGGVSAYELICAATDPLNPDFTDAINAFERAFGDGLTEDSHVVTTPFDIDEINYELADLGLGDEAGRPDEGAVAGEDDVDGHDPGRPSARLPLASEMR
jgi:hypothetical protein